MPAKIQAMELERTEGVNTVEAFERLGLPPDLRSYEDALEILKDIHISGKVRLVTNNPQKKQALEVAGYMVAEVVRLDLVLNEITKQYLRMKKEKLGHEYIDVD